FVLLGVATDGVSRWGFASVLQSTAELEAAGSTGYGTAGTGSPTFDMATAYPGGVGTAPAPPVVDGVVLEEFGNVTVKWTEIPAEQADSWAGFSLLVDDVVGYQGNATEFTLFLVPPTNWTSYYTMTASTTATSTTTTAASTASTASTASRGGSSSSTRTAVSASATASSAVQAAADAAADYTWYLSTVPHYFRVAYLSVDGSTVGDYSDAATLGAGGTTWT
ncbi:hypothetical protein HK405_001691, partial [Cladochytrium tenue]